MNLLIDHPIRHILQNLMCYVPGVTQLQRARATTGAMNNPSVMAHWASLIVKDITASGKTLSGARLLEIGPGHSMGVAFGLLAAGAQEVYALDVQRYAELSNLDPYKAVISECQRIGLLPQQANILAENLVSRLHYELVNDDGRWPVEDRSIDVVYSYFSGEHLRRPGDVVHAIRRVLQPDGMCIFAIDLEDHLHREDNWLQFLYYEPRLWKAMTSQRGCWTNRLLVPDWRALFEQYFGEVRITETKRSIPSNFDVERLASAFEKYNLSVLSTCSLWVVAAHPRRVA